jgi:hypothetical protein
MVGAGRPQGYCRLDLCAGSDDANRLQWSGKEHLFVHRLRRQFGIDAGGAEEEELLRPRGIRGANNIERDGEVVGQEVNRMAIVEGDAADFGRCQNDRVGFGCAWRAKKLATVWKGFPSSRNASASRPGEPRNVLPRRQHGIFTRSGSTINGG